MNHEELLQRVFTSEDQRLLSQSVLVALSGGADSANVPTCTLKDEDFREGSIDIMGVLVASGLCQTRSEARRNVQQGGVSMDGTVVKDIAASYKPEDFEGEGKLVKRGKKNFVKVVR